jgi:hypothetical protein
MYSGSRTVLLTVASCVLLLLVVIALAVARA